MTVVANSCYHHSNFASAAPGVGRLLDSTLEQGQRVWLAGWWPQRFGEPDQKVPNLKFVPMAVPGLGLEIWPEHHNRCSLQLPVTAPWFVVVEYWQIAWWVLWH